MLSQFNNIESSGFGYDIRIKYVSNLNTYKTIVVTVTNTCEINIASKGTLNQAGQQALKDAISLTEILIRNK